MIVKKIVIKLFMYLFISKKIIIDNKIKKIKIKIIDNLKLPKRDAEIKQIKKKGINAKNLLIPVFFDVKTFNP